MATEGTLFPSTSPSPSPSPFSVISLLFFLILFLSVPSSMAEKEESLPSSATRSRFIDPNRLRISSSRRDRLTSTLGTASSSSMSGSSSPQVSSTDMVRVQRGGGRHGPRVHRRSRLPWQEKIFNAGEHEVPSGPNPISNR